MQRDRFNLVNSKKLFYFNLYLVSTSNFCQFCGIVPFNLRSFMSKYLTVKAEQWNVYNSIPDVFRLVQEEYLQYGLDAECWTIPATLHLDLIPGVKLVQHWARCVRPWRVRLVVTYGFFNFPRFLDVDDKMRDFPCTSADVQQAVHAGLLNLEDPYNYFLSLETLAIGGSKGPTPGMCESC